MKRIAIISSNPFSIGGLQRVTFAFANMMSKENEVDLICTDTDVVVDKSIYGMNNQVNVIVDSLGLNTNIFIKGLRYINRRFFGIRNLSFLQYIYIHSYDFKYLVSFIKDKRYDAIIALQLRYSIILGAIADRVNCKLIGWQHNTYDAYFNNKGNYYWNQELLAKKYLSELSNCIVLSESDKEKYKELLNLNVERIYNPNSIKTNKTLDIKKYNYKTILWVGRLVWKQKGLDYLIEIIKKVSSQFDDIRWLVVGDGPDRKRMEKLIERNDLSNFVEMYGYTKQIEELYDRAYLLISTSRWEGFGLNIVEAMSWGVPVIAFDNSGPNEIIINENHGGIIIPRYDVDKFANEVTNIITDEGRRNRIALNAYNRSKDFCEDVIVAEWDKVIGEVEND